MIFEVFAFALLMVLVRAAVGRSLEQGEWDGFVSLGRSGDSFRPCGSRQTWWVKGKGFTKALGELREQYNEIAQRPYDQVYMRVSGEISKKGQFGPLGSYQRVLYIEEVQEIRASREGDCEKD